MAITYSNIQVTKVLTLRGNTIQNNRYTGLPGELTVDTEAKTIRIHDGVTPGGNVIQGGGGIGSGSYSNVNVKAYTESMGFSNYSNSNVRSYFTGGFDGNILPSANVTYSLGSPTRQWKDLYVSNNTIYIGGTPVSISGGGLSVGGVGVTDTATGITESAGRRWFQGNIGYQLDAGYTGGQIAFGGGGFLATMFYGIVNYSSSNAFAYSTDAINWTYGYLPYNSTYSNVSRQDPSTRRPAAYGANGWVIPVTLRSTITSADGITWTNNSNALPAWTSGYGPSAIVYGNGVYVLLVSGPSTLTSTNGTTWANGSISTDNLSTNLGGSAGAYGSYYITDIAFGGGVFIAVGGASTGIANSSPSSRIFISTDGKLWSNVNISRSAIWNRVGYGDGVFVAVTTSSNLAIRSTDNGTTWSNISLPVGFDGTTGLAFGSGTWSAVRSDSRGYGYNGNIAISTDNGITWANVSSPDVTRLEYPVTGGDPSFKAPYQDIAFGKASFVAIGLGQGGLNSTYNNVLAVCTPTVKSSYGSFTDVAIIGSLSITGGISAGNVTANYFVGNGSLLTALPGYAYSNVNVAAYVTTANSAILGYINQANTIQSAQVGAANLAITAANVGLKGYIDLANTIQSGQVGAANLAITTANTAMKGYVDSQTFYSNARVATYLQYGNIANISAAGNITASYFIGNGALLTGIAASSNYSNVNVATYLPTYAGNIANIRLGVAGVLTFADGTTQTTAATGGGSSYSNVNVAAYLTTNSYLTSNLANLSNYAYAANVTSANVGLKGYVDQANSIQSAQMTAANVGIIGYIDQGNTIQAAAITAANVGMLGYVNSQSFYSNTKVATYLPTYSGNIAANISKAGYTWTFGTGGTTQFPNSLILAPASQSITMQSDQYSQLMWENANVTVAPNMAINSNFYVAQNNATLDIGYRDGSSTQIIKSWYWNADGNLKLPSGGYILNSDDSIYGGSSYSNVQVATYLTSANISSTQLYNAGYTAQLNTAAGNGTLEAYYLLGDTEVLTQGKFVLTYAGVANKQFAWALTDGANAVFQGTRSSSLDTNILTVGAATGNLSVLGNVTAPYFIGNGALLTGIVASGGNYSNVDVANYLPTYSGNIANIRLGTSGVLTFADGTTQITAGGAGGSNYSNANVATYLAGSSTVFIGNVGNVATVYPLQSNITQVFIGGNTVITSGNASNPNATFLMYNGYFSANGEIRVRNTTIGMGYLAIEASGFTLAGYTGPATANTLQARNIFLTMNGSTGAVFSGIVSSPGVTSTGTVAVNAATGITTNQGTFLLANATATTINMGGAATTINLGTTASATGNVFVGGQIGSNTYNLTLRANGRYNVASSINSNGGFNSPPYANQLVIGGTGTGMTANYSSTGGYIDSLTIYNSGTGYRNGDVISVPGGIAGNSFVLQNYSPNRVGAFTGTALYTFGIDGNLTLAGNVIFPSNSYIFGDFSNATVNARTVFTPSAANASPGIYAAPSGTGTGASWQAANSGNLTAASKILIATNGSTDVQLVSGINGSGTYLPLSFYNNGAAQMQLTVAGNLNMTVNNSVATSGTGNFIGNAVGTTATYTGNVTAANFVGNISITGNVTGTSANVTLQAGAYTSVFDNQGNVRLPTAYVTGNVTANYFVGNGSLLTGVAIKTTGSWTVPTGNSTQSFTVPASGTYQLWVDCNIPNGILAWNATATVTNTNVPVVGAQYAWVYTGGGTPVDFTSIPNQFTGTGNTIVRSSTAPSATTNRFDFGINNTSGGNITVRYGYVSIS